MKLIALLVFSLFMLLPSQSDARIAVGCDNFTNTITYKVRETGGNIGIVERRFIKWVDIEEKENYYFLFGVRQERYSVSCRYLFNEEMDISIDGAKYKAKKVVGNNHPKILPGMPGGMYFIPKDYVMYLISDNCIDAIKNAKSITYSVYCPTQNPYTFNISPNHIAEMKNIIENGHFANYLEDINKLTNKYKLSN